MSFFDNPIANISGGISTLGKDVANVTKNPLVDMAAAAALDYFTGGAGELVGSGGLFDAGLGSAGNAALVTGGIAGLASGNLAQGLMAGMAGYGGASLGEGLGMGNYSSGIGSSNVAAGAPSAGNYQQIEEAPVGKAPTPSMTEEPTRVMTGAQANAAGLPGTVQPTTPMPGASSAAGASGKSLFQKFQDLPFYEQAAIGAGGIGLLKAAAQPQKLNVPAKTNTQFIRNYSYNPMGGYSYQGATPASGGGAATGGLVALAHGGQIHHYDDGGTTATDSQNPMQSTIQSWVAAHPDASSSDVASAVNSYIQSTGSNTKDIYNTLGQMAAQNPGQYESTLQNFNTAENIDPNTQFASWLKQNSTPTGAGNFNTPTQSAILQEAYQLGVDPSQVNQLGLEEGIGPGSNIFQSLADNAKIASTLVGDNSNIYSLLSGTGDAETQAKFDTLSGVLGRTNRANYANADFQTLANAGVDPATYAAVTGLTPSTAIAAYNNTLNPQGAGDALAAQAGLAKGTQYQLGRNGFGQQVLTYTDPKTQQQMMYTPAVSRTDPGTSNKTYNMSSVGEYASVPTTGMQSNSLFNTVGNQAYTYGQDQYTNPFNTQGQVDTTSSASLDAAYEKGLISASAYAKAKQALTQKSAGGGLMALATGGAIKHYDGSAGSAVSSDPGVAPTQAQLDAVNAAYQAGNYQQVQNLVDQYGVTSADVSRYAPTFDQSVLASQGIGLAGQDVLSAPVAANAVQSFANPDVSGTNLTQAEINQMQNAYGAKDYAAANAMANQYGLTQADLTALYGNTAPSAATLASQGITLPGSTTASNADIAATNLSLPVINQMYDAWQTGDYKTAQALATQSGLTSQDLSNLFPNFNQNELALAGIQLGLKPQVVKPTVTTTDAGTTATGVGGPATTTQTLLPTNPQTNAPAGTTNPYGNVNNPGDITKNADGTITVTPNIPGRPYGGFSGMNEVVNAYTAGGGSTGYVNPVYQNMDQFNAANNTLSGGSKAAYDYLMGKSPWNPLPTTPTGQVSVPYQQLMGLPMSNQYQVSTPQIYDAATHTYKPNPNYDPNFSATRDYLGSPQVGISSNTAKILGYTALPNGIYGYSNGDGTFTGIDGHKYDSSGKDLTATTVQSSAAGGLQGLAGGGMAVGHLGGYSDGGRLLRGPGDGVSDSIPATIGSTDPEPARLADGEFVVPARIVSELGNGSTEAGARQLYKMMDRIQQARRKTTGKDAVATNTNASKYLPA